MSKEKAGEQLHRLVFRGDILIGFDQKKARSNLSRLLKVNDNAKLSLLFSGRPVVIKKNLHSSQVEKYQNTLERAGILVSVEPPLVVHEPELSSSFTIDEHALVAVDNAVAQASADSTIPTISASFSALSFAPVEGPREKPEKEPVIENITVDVRQIEPLAVSTAAPSTSKLQSLGIFLTVVMTVAIFFILWAVWSHQAAVVQPLESQTHIQAPPKSEFEKSLENVEDLKLREQLRQLQVELQELDKKPAKGAL
ncbi:hypothetical protein [Sansalvadorimonas verongulae]|uniref:hypothetical protein n=1 Tax=Sansalvadorimonas verongulae TaxID=2172824 RepID=UPI0012BD1AA0|nr:hypothetical protein [Sansalvadorimonas verongulae]MTI14343.1 hypothetical protein [Sansalvadorimonas verongulae]